MTDLLSFGLFAFTSFLAIINPMGVTPVFLAMTSELSPKQQRRTAFKAVLTAFVVLTIFAFAGRLLFQFFGISVNGFRIAGGVIFFIMGYDMLNARLSRLKYDDQNVEAQMDDIAITPLGIPMIAGPGAITNAIVLMQDATDLQHQIVLPIAIFVVLTVTFLSLVGGGSIMKFMGETGNKIMLKLMGLIMMVIAVEFFFAGLKPIIQDMLNIVPAS
ncbi:MAG: antibiotic resistance protein MarC [Bacteroidetes bacterium]|nr:MAG: antibiotic resistance protein MarC [Bacteroidota bacterium]